MRFEIRNPAAEAQINDEQDRFVFEPDFDLQLEEEYIPDERMDLRPSDYVQSKLLASLPKGRGLPVSCLHNRRMVRR